MARGDFEYIYNELFELLENLGLDIDGCAGDSEEEAREKYPDYRYHIWLKEKTIAYGEILVHRRCGKKTLLDKIKEIQTVAKRKNIPFCYLEGVDKIFICKAEDDVSEIEFGDEWPALNQMYDSYERDFVTTTPEDFRKEWAQMIKEGKELTGGEWLERLSKIEFKDSDFQITTSEMRFTREKEDEVFRAILGHYQGGYVYRYMSAESLFRILSSEKASMCSIAAMNDKTETSYVDDYCKFPSNTNMYPNEIEKSQQSLLVNMSYISSCVGEELCDDLTMWRLYGDNGRGVCLKFRVDLKGSEDFYLAPVSYAWEDGLHPELSFMSGLAETKIKGTKFVLHRFTIWKHFFKPYEYRIENEIRLFTLFTDTEKMKWVTNSDGIYFPIVEFSMKKDACEYPLVLENIILGPNFPHKETNKKQIKFRLNNSELDCAYSYKAVIDSDIRSYR